MSAKPRASLRGKGGEGVVCVCGVCVCGAFVRAAETVKGRLAVRMLFSASFV